MKKSPFLLLAGFLPATALAALVPEPAVAPLEVFGMSIDLKPGLMVGISNDSNVYTEIAARADDSMIYTLSPSLSLRVGDDLEFSEVLLSTTGGWVEFDDADNFTDYNAAFSGQYEPAGNLQVTTRFGTSQGHDERGTGNTDRCSNGVIPNPGPFTRCVAEPNIFQDVSGNFAVMLGNAQTRGRLTFGVDALGRRYTNNDGAAVASETIAPGSDGLEYDMLGFSLKLAFKAGGSTSAVLEVRQADTDYTFGNTAVDSVEVEYLGGVEWDVTGKTSGYLKGGISEKDFAAALSKDLSEPAWRAGTTWMPTERSMLNVELARQFRESAVSGTIAKDVTTWSFNALHRVNDRVEPFLRVSQDQVDYPGVTRNDEALRVTAGVDYKFRRWAVLGASWAHTSETISAAPAIGGNSDYVRNVVLLSANLTL